MNTDQFGYEFERMNPKYSDPEHPLAEDGIEEFVSEGIRSGRPIETHAQRALNAAYEDYKAKGGSMTKWAKAVEGKRGGRSRNTVSMWLSDPLRLAKMTREDVERTAELFGVSVSYLQRNTIIEDANSGYLSIEGVIYYYMHLSDIQKRLISSMILEMEDANHTREVYNELRNMC